MHSINLYEVKLSACTTKHKKLRHAAANPARFCSGRRISLSSQSTSGIVSFSPKDREA